MKKTFFSLLMALVALSAIAQGVGDAFYIYRNDGQFNAFFRDEVDSIAYSYYDTDSVYYNDIVTQVIYTPDSIYRIPLAAIDSVSFVQPETILRPNVVMMEQVGMSDYLKSVDGMCLFFDTSIPNSLTPKVGDILFSTDFDNPLFNEGFVGKVIDTKKSTQYLQVCCDSVYDLTDIFVQLISIEKIKDDNNNPSNSNARRISGEWASSRNPVNFNLGFSRHLSDGEVSLSGAVEGTYIATVAYKITLKEQYVNLKLHHDWQYNAHLKLKSNKDFGTLEGNVNSLPAIRFPAVAPVFKFQIAGCPFIKGEGNLELDFSLNSPVHSYLGEVTYHNGHFRGSNKRMPVSGNNNPSFDTAFSLNGSVQTGYMVDFWLGTINAIGSYLRTGLDFYIGPKMTGDFTMKIGTGNPINYYSMFKDSKFGLSLLTVDYEFYGEAAFAGHKFPRAMFCNGTFQTPLYHEWYIMPEFSDLNIKKDLQNLSATISTTPTRDILFPLSVGLGLYDKSGSLLDKRFQSKKYKRENEGYKIQQTFSSLELNTEYTARPLIKILDGEVPALPTEKFKLDVTSCPDSNHPHWIDLGLPSGTQWRCCNEGASTPEAYGGYYTFGQVASAPSADQIEELVNNTISYGSFLLNDVCGSIFIGKNGVSIFLPAAGYRWDGGLHGVGELGYYWSSSWAPNKERYGACYFNISSSNYFWDWNSFVHRGIGLSVRPVR